MRFGRAHASRRSVVYGVVPRCILRTQQSWPRDSLVRRRGQDAADSRIGSAALGDGAVPLRRNISRQAAFSCPSVPRPPTSQVLTPPHTAQQPSAVPLTASTVRRAAAAKKEADAKVEARRSVNAALSGMDLVTSPNVFRGMSASGELLEMPQKLGREEELELVQHALLYCLQRCRACPC